MLLRLGSRAYDVATRALVMAVVDPLPPGLVDTAAALVNAGADLLEVGLAAPVRTAEEELARVAPAVEQLAARFDRPVAVATSRAAAAGAAIEAGACLCRDRRGFADPGYLATVAKGGGAVVVTAAGAADLAEVCDELVALARRAEAAGIGPAHVVVDGGLDLGRTAEEAVALLGGSTRLAALGHPLLLSLAGAPFAGEAELAAAALGVTLGCRIVRVTDVTAARRVCDTLAAVSEAGP